MDNTIFPVGFVIDEDYLSFEEMKVHEKGWDIKSSEMEDGPFQSKIYAVHTPHIQLAYQVYSKAMFMSGLYPKKCILLYIANSETPPVVDHLPTLENELCIGFEGKEVDVLLNNACTYYTIAVEEELFLREYYKYFGVTLEETTTLEKLLIDKDNLTAFFEGIHAWVNYLSSQELKATFENRYDGIELEILNFIFGSIVVEKKRSRRSKFDIQVARERLEKCLEQDINIRMLAKDLNISERQLHNAFKANYGVSPKKFLQQLRLNAIKHELLIANPKQTTISNIAFKYKFLHMSHFTNEYKKLFGQTPSTTLQHKIVVD